MSISKILSVLNPPPKIGGLEIDESGVRYALIRGKNVASASLRLPAGVVEAGTIKNQRVLTQALLDLRRQIMRSRRGKISVVLSIPDVNVYTQSFGLPLMAEEGLKEAVKLNLQMISPIDYERAYSGWQKVGESEVGGGELEILTAFAPKNTIDEYAKVATDAGFSIVAVEFPSLALTRFLGARTSENVPEAFILVRLSSGGFSFSIVRKNKLYFNRSTLWQADAVSLKKLEEILTEETQKVLNFYAGRLERPISNIFLIIPKGELEQKIADILKNNFAAKIDSFRTLVSGRAAEINLSSFSPEWYPALGSALRGLTPRFEDTDISLSGATTIEKFEQEEIMNFVRLWRNIVLTSLAAIIILFLGVEYFLIGTAKALSGSLAGRSQISPESSELAALENQAADFNKLVGAALVARSQATDWTPYLETIANLAGPDLAIQRLFIQSIDGPVVFAGQALSQTAILNFKDAVSRDPKFSDVNLPLSSINPVSGGLTSFTLTFKIKQQSRSLK